MASFRDDRNKKSHILHDKNEVLLKIPRKGIKVLEKTQPLKWKTIKGFSKKIYLTLIL